MNVEEGSENYIAITEKLYDALNVMVQYATEDSPVYFQLFLDKNFLLGQNKPEFRKLVADLVDELKGTHVHMRYAHIEKGHEYPYNDLSIKLDESEHYWSAGWANANAESWIDYLPLPKRHAKRYNKKYKEENPNTTILIISHYPMLFEYLNPDVVNILYNGKIVKTEDYNLAKDIFKNGYSIPIDKLVRFHPVSMEITKCENLENCCGSKTLTM